MITVLLLIVAGFSYGSTNEECEDYCSNCCPCCGTGFFSADFIYWKVHHDGFGCGCNEINNSVNRNGNVISTARGTSKDPHFNWDAGFRIGTGYEFTNQNWDVGVYWTHFHTHIHNQHQSNQFRWKLDYDVIDMLIGRNFCLESFIVRPFIGLRAAQIEQKIKSISHVAYKTFFFTNSFSSSDSSYGNLSNSLITDYFRGQENNRETFRGIGPLIGIEIDWNLGCGFSIYGCVAVCSLYGCFSATYNSRNTFLGGTNICDKNAHLRSYQIATDALLGIRWEQCFCNNILLTFQLALEQHRYFDHSHLGSYGNLTLDGFSFSGGLSF